MKTMTFTIPFSQWTGKYTEDNIKKSLENVRDQLNKCVIIGEMNHPDNNYETINLSNVSHSITDLKYDDIDATIDVKILDTPCGRMVNEALSFDCIKLEPRIVGTDNDMKIITFDFVKK